MKFRPTSLKGAYLIDLELKQDDRGFFARYFCEKEFSDHGLNTHWVQINNSLSREAGTLRGLHFQYPPYCEVKLVRCLRGAIWDVIVDIREGSETFCRWFGATLSSENRTMMYVPKGFAHGFLTLEPDSEILYLVSEYYRPSAEGILVWSDVEVGIEWPVIPTVISEKDKRGDQLLNTQLPIKV